MRINSSCEACLYEKEMNRSLEIPDDKKREAFLQEIRQALSQREIEICAPEMVSLFVPIRNRYGVAPDHYPKAKYNQMIMELEEKLEQNILCSRDPLETALLYSRVGNYIDFAALDEVRDDELLQMIEEAGKGCIEKNAYRQFVKDCSKASSVMILCDNCGEIVFDKLLARQLRRSFPQLTIRAMVRGADVQNDATLEDAVQSGMSLEAEVVTNGSGIAGTVYSKLSSEARSAFDQSDVILSKGQGNYESLVGSHQNVYYLFLCKCDLFIRRFQVPKLTGMFIHEDGRKK